MVYRKDYHCIRKIIVSENSTKTEYKVACLIYPSTLNIPLFVCTLIDAESTTPKSFTSNNPTGCMRKIFNELNIKPKKNWNGHSFFGLDRKDFPKPVSSTSTNNPVDMHSYATSYKSNRDAIWIGVKSLGMPTLDILYQHAIKKCGRSIYLRPGYEAIRGVRTGNSDKIVELHCQIKSSITGPVFRCYAPSDSEIDFTSNVATSAVTLALEKISHTTKKNWSGYEFFGLLKPDVLNLIIVPPQSDNNDDSKKKKFSDYKDTDRSILRDAENLHIRDGGATSNLKSKQAQRNRNGTIHKLVQFASFHDVKGNIFAI